MIGQQRISHIVGYIFVLLNGLLSICVFLDINVPWIFATPSVFALVAFSLLFMALYLLGLAGKSHLTIKLTLLSYFFVVLLIFPNSFDFRDLSSSGFFSFGLYRMILVLLAYFTIHLVSLIIFGREIPILLLLVIVPSIILFQHWYLNRDTSLSELRTLTVILIAVIPVCLLFGWLRQRI